MRININGTDYPLLNDTLRIRKKADKRDSCSFRMLVTPEGSDQIFDGLLEVGYISPVDGLDQANAARSRSVSYIPVTDDDHISGVLLSRDQYTISGPPMTDFRIMYYGEQYEFLSSDWFVAGNIQEDFWVPTGAKWIRFTNAATNDTTLQYMISKPGHAYEDWDRFIPRVGMDLKVYDEDRLEFAGVIKDCPLRRPGGPDSAVFCDVSSDGYNDILARRTVGLYRSNVTAGSIVTGLITSYLSEEGITAGTIDAGANITEYRATAKSTLDIIEDMADFSGYQWWVDAQRKLHFKENFTPVITNEILNGNFVTTADWSAGGFNTSISAAANTLTADSTIGGVPAGFSQDTNIPVTLGDRVFVRFRVARKLGIYNFAQPFISDALGSLGNTVFGNSWDLHDDGYRYIYDVMTVDAAISGGNLHVGLRTEADNILYVMEAMLIFPDEYVELEGLSADEIHGALLMDWFSGSQELILSTKNEIGISDLSGPTFLDYQDLQLTENIEMYRNKQFVRGDVLASGNTRSSNRQLDLEIDARRRVEGGGSGVYGSVANFPWARSYTALGNAALRLLDQYGRAGPPKELTFKSNSRGYMPNQLMRVYLPAMGIYHVVWFLIDEVEIQQRGLGREYFVKAISRVEGDFSSRGQQSAEQFFRKITAQSSNRELSVPVTNNLVYDHSFELIAHTGGIDATHGDFLTTLSTAITNVWGRVGDPRIFSEYGSTNNEPYVLFGKQAAVCNEVNYIRQRVKVRENTTYTLSFYCFPHPTRNTAGNPARQLTTLFYLDATPAAISNEVRTTDLETVTPATVVQDQRRIVYTFTTPANTAWVEIRLRGSGAVPTWVVYDGVQLLEGDLAGMYEPENQLFEMTRRGII